MKIERHIWKKSEIIGGDIALDFVNTASGWDLTPKDWLGGNIKGFAEWAKLSGLYNKDDFENVSKFISRHPEKGAKTYRKVVRFRNALRRIFINSQKAEPISETDVKLLTKWVERACRHQTLVYSRGNFFPEWKPNTPLIEKPLLSIALSSAKFLEEEKFKNIKTCQGVDCGWLFLDTSKNQSRRWCSMRTCGNTNKVRNFRKKNK